MSCKNFLVISSFKKFVNLQLSVQVKEVWKLVLESDEKLCGLIVFLDHCILYISVIGADCITAIHWIAVVSSIPAWLESMCLWSMCVLWWCLVLWSGCWCSCWKYSSGLQISLTGASCFARLYYYCFRFVGRTYLSNAYGCSSGIVLVVIVIVVVVVVVFSCCFCQICLGLLCWLR